jgi:hypothetical protein
MNKLLIAAATSLVAFTPMSAQAASVRNTVIATTAVSYCAYQMGHMTLAEAAEFGAEYLNDQGISVAQSDRIMDTSDFNDEVVATIEMGGGCEKITEDF